MAKKSSPDPGLSFAVCIKKLRTEYNMTQGDIVRATGLERGYVSNLEAGKIRHPRIVTVIRVANAFGMRLSEFIIYCE